MIKKRYEGGASGRVEEPWRREGEKRRGGTWTMGPGHRL